MVELTVVVILRFFLWKDSDMTRNEVDSRFYLATYSLNLSK